MRFKVGDVVVLLLVHPESDMGQRGFRGGEEGTVKGTYPDVIVDFPGFANAWISPEHLRLKRPPQTELGTWESIERITGWHPEREVA